MDAPAPMLLRPQEAAEELGVSRGHLYNLLKSGELASVKFGRSRRIARTELAAFVERHRTASLCPAERLPEAG